MFRTRVSIAVAAAVSAMVVSAAAQQTPAPTPQPAATEKKAKLTKQKLGEMRAKWQANRPKLKACQSDAKKKGLAGDDRWFFIEECMDKS